MQTKCEDCDEVRRKRTKPYALCDLHLKRYHQDWRRGNKKKVLDAQRRYRQKIKLEAFTHYSAGSPKCNCCGETNIIFLTMDHIDGGGNKHKRKIRARLPVWLRQNNYPEGYQVLCFNCNCGKSINKNICPHKDNTAKTK